MDEGVASPQRPDPGVPTGDRLEELEQQVRQLTGRLTGWVEDQLTRALDDRREDLRAVRVELEGLRAELHRALAEGLAGVSALGPANDALEQRVRSAMSRLSESMETRLGALAATPMLDADRLRNELTAVFDEQLSQTDARSAAALGAVQDRLAGLSTLLGQRVDAVVAQAAAASEAAGAAAAGQDALRSEMGAAVAEAVAGAAALGAASDALEQRVRSAMNRLTDTMEGRLAALAAAPKTGDDAVRADLTAMVDRRLADAAAASASELSALGDRLGEVSTAFDRRMSAVVAQAAAGTDEVARLTAAAAEADTRTEAFEERVKSAISRLTDSLETRVGETATVRQLELDRLRAELGERVAGIETALAEQVAAATARVEGLDSTVASDGTRLESLELHTRRTDAKLTQLVEEKLGELQLDRVAEIEQVRTDLAAALVGRLGDVRVEMAAAASAAAGALAASVAESDAKRRELTATLAADLAQVRAESDLKAEEVAAAVRAELRQALADHAGELEGRLAAAADATRSEMSAGLDALRGAPRAAGSRLQALEKRVQRGQDREREIEARIDRLVGARKADAQALGAELAELRGSVASALEGIDVKASRTQERVGKRLDELRARIDEMAAAMAKAASGALAPLRSDMRVLQRQLEELAEAAAARPGRRTPTKEIVSTGKDRPAVDAAAPEAEPVARSTKRALSTTKALSNTKALSSKKALSAKKAPSTRKDLSTRKALSAARTALATKKAPAADKDAPAAAPAPAPAAPALRPASKPSSAGQ